MHVLTIHIALSLLRIALIALSIFFFCGKSMGQVVVRDMKVTGNVTENTGSWAKRIGSGRQDLGQDITLDAQGNIYITGAFQDTVDFGGIVLVSAGRRDAYSAKYDSAGKLVWANRAGGNYDDIGLGIAVDRFGNCYVTGALEDRFLAKYRPDGNLEWSKQNIFNTSNDVALDSAGNIYVAGLFEGRQDFDGIVLESMGSSDIFVAKYHPDGSIEWVERAGGTSSDGASSVAVDVTGNVYITGTFSEGEEVILGNDTLISSGGDDIFVIKYDSTGHPVWADRIGGSDHDWSGNIAVDASGNVYVAANYGRGPLIGFGDDTLAGTEGSEVLDILLVKYDADGSGQWARRAGGSSTEYTYDLAIDAAQNIYLAGICSENAKFGEYTLKQESDHWSDGFIAKYHPDGRVEWARNPGDGGADYDQSITVDMAGRIYVVGSFQGTAVFGVDTLVSAGGYDSFIWKYEEQKSESSVRESDDKLAANDASAGILDVYPNPTQTTAEIKVKVSVSGPLHVAVMDMLGRSVAPIFDGEIQSGQHILQFNTGRLVTGCYYILLTTPTVQYVHRMDVVK